MKLVKTKIKDCYLIKLDKFNDKRGFFTRAFCKKVFNQKPAHILVATKYKNTVTNYFAEKGIRAECIKLNGAIELAPKLGICSSIVDLVSTGKTLNENNLEETEVLLNITSKLIVNKVAYKIMNNEISDWVKKFEKALDEQNH